MVQPTEDDIALNDLLGDLNLIPGDISSETEYQKWAKLLEELQLENPSEDALGFGGDNDEEEELEDERDRIIDVDEISTIRHNTADDEQREA